MALFLGGLAVLFLTAAAWVILAVPRHVLDVKGIGSALFSLVIGAGAAGVGRSDLREAAAIAREEELRKRSAEQRAG